MTNYQAHIVQVGDNGHPAILLSTLVQAVHEAKEEFELCDAGVATFLSWFGVPTEYRVTISVPDITFTISSTDPDPEFDDTQLDRDIEQSIRDALEYAELELGDHVGPSVATRVTIARPDDD